MTATDHSLNPRLITRNSPFMLCNFISVAKCYVSMKNFAESRGSLDIPPINANVNPTVHSLCHA